MESNKKDKYINIDILLIMINDPNKVLDFNNALLSLFKNSTQDRVTDILFHVMNGGLVLGHKDIKDVYARYANLINLIEKTTGLYYYTYAVFENGNVSKTFEEYLDYVRANQKNRDSMLPLALEFKKLGITKVSLVNDLKSSSVYTCPIGSEDAANFMYGENPKVLASYDKGSIKYQIPQSNYLLPLRKVVKSVKLSDCNTIYVKNILFDKSVLPTKLDYNHTFGELVDLRVNVINETTNLRDRVDVNVAVMDLIEQYNKTREMVQNTTTISEKEAMIQDLEMMKSLIDSISLESSKANQETDVVSLETINEETDNYIRQRKNNMLSSVKNN